MDNKASNEYYRDKVGLVTGAGSGIGRAMAIAFAAAGAKVLVAVNTNLQGGHDTVQMIQATGGTASVVQANVASEEQVSAMVATAVREYGRLDFAVNNAGIQDERGPLAETPEADFDRIFSVNVKSIFLCMKHEIRQMLPQGKGAIVNIASIGAFRPQPGIALYTASKRAVLGLTQNAALDYAHLGIRINAICPGIIDTPMLATGLQNLEQSGISPEHVYAQMTLIGRPGQPEEIAKAALWLCSDDASFTHGHALMVDGGYLSR